MIWGSAWASAWQSAWSRLVGGAGATVAQPGTGSLVFSGYAPTVDASAATTFVPRAIGTVRRPTPKTARVSFVGHIPTVDARVVVPEARAIVKAEAEAGSALFVVQSFAPAVRGGVAPVVRPLPPSLTVTRYAPTVVRPRDARPSAGGVAWVGMAPTVPVVVDARPLVAVQQWNGYAPTVDAEVVARGWSLEDEERDLDDVLMLVALL